MNGKVEVSQEYVRKNIRAEAMRDERQPRVWILPANIANLSPNSGNHLTPKQSHWQQESD
jgi:hypothetical protein